MSDVLPLPGPQKGDCPCGCGLFGTVRKKKMADGLNHVARCQCKRCAGSRYGKNANRRENRIAKDTGGSREPLSGALSGIDGSSGLWVWEETSNRQIVATIERWWHSKGVRDKCARLMNRSGAARCLILSWGARLKPQLVVIPYEDWASMVRPADEQEAS